MYMLQIQKQTMCDTNTNAKSGTNTQIQNTLNFSKQGVNEGGQQIKLH